MDWGSEILRGRSRDMSEQGIFILMDNPLWVGAACTARLLVDGQAVPVNLLVKRVQPLTGIAAVFVDLPEESQQKISDYLRALSK